MHLPPNATKLRCGAARDFFFMSKRADLQISIDFCDTLQRFAIHATQRIELFFYPLNLFSPRYHNSLQFSRALPSLCKESEPRSYQLNKIRLKNRAYFSFLDFFRDTLRNFLVVRRQRHAIGLWYSSSVIVSYVSGRSGSGFSSQELKYL